MIEDIDEVIKQIKEEEDVFSKAKLINFLNKKKDIRIKNLAEKLGLKPSYLCHILRLNRVPLIIIDGYYSKMITLSHLFVISRLKEEKMMIDVYENILTNNFNVPQTEIIVREILYDVKSLGTHIPKQEIQELIKKISSKYKDINLKITQTRTKSKLEVEIRGDLEKTSEVLKKLMKKIEEWINA